MRSREEIRVRQRVCLGFVAAAEWFALRQTFLRLIGRQAPVKRCLARCRESKNEIRNSKIGEAYCKNFTALAVGKHLPDGGDVSGTD